MVISLYTGGLSFIDILCMIQPLHQKAFGSADCDTIYTIYLSLCSQSADPNPSRDGLKYKLFAFFQKEIWAKFGIHRHHCHPGLFNPSQQPPSLPAHLLPTSSYHPPHAHPSPLLFWSV